LFISAFTLDVGCSPGIPVVSSLEVSFFRFPPVALTCPGDHRAASGKGWFVKISFCFRWFVEGLVK
jgi:hypothetical protein